MAEAEGHRGPPVDHGGVHAGPVAVVLAEHGHADLVGKGRQALVVDGLPMLALVDGVGRASTSSALQPGCSASILAAHPSWLPGQTIRRVTVAMFWFTRRSPATKRSRSRNASGVGASTAPIDAVTSSVGRPCWSKVPSTSRNRVRWASSSPWVGGRSSPRRGCRRRRRGSAGRRWRFRRRPRAAASRSCPPARPRGPGRRRRRSTGTRSGP